MYLHPLDGVGSIPGMVWQLKKALYGLKHARLEWFCTLCSHIQSIGYAQSGHDPCLYVMDPEMFVVIYVDDLLVVAPKSSIARRKKELAGRYKMCDLSEAHWFLAM